MKSLRLILSGSASLSSVLLLTGCANNEYGHTSPYHPGPVVGKTVGQGVGVVAGNMAGVGVGAVEGTAQGLAAPFDPSYPHGNGLDNRDHAGRTHHPCAARYFGGSIWPAQSDARAHRQFRAGQGSGKHHQRRTGHRKII